MFYPPPDATATRLARPNRFETARMSAPSPSLSGRRPRRNNDRALPLVAHGSGDALQHTQTLQPSSEAIFPSTYPIQPCGVTTANHLSYRDETSADSAAQNVAGNGSVENAGLNHIQMLMGHLEMQMEATQERIIELEKTVHSMCALLIKMDFLWEKGLEPEGLLMGRSRNE